MNRFFHRVRERLSPDGTLLLWLAMWWVVNLLTAGFSELADDEAYYHLFAQHLAWGYFDHPPVTALFVWLGEHLFGGELGVRFFFTLLQPAYLYILWRLVKPADADRRDADLFAMLSASMLILQLYGFIAVPDGPLLFSTALFLLTFKHFAEERPWSWLTMGAAIGFMAYCKYHGALVLIFTLAANAGLFLRKPKRILYLAASGLAALAVITPHLLWQYRHDWVSFLYHLSDRNGVFAVGNITDFLLNMAVVFSPFYLPLWVQAYRKVKAATPVESALKLFPPAFIGFFTVSSLRGYVQPQWAIAAVFGLVWILFAYARRHPRTRRYAMRAGAATIALVILVRIVMVFNPFGLIRFEVFDNRASYGQIAAEADGRPVIFHSRYAEGAKYIFYTGGEAFCQPNVDRRTSQWQFRDDDRRFAGREVAVVVNPAKHSGDEVRTLTLANGKRFSYVILDDFRPTREVAIEADGFAMPAEVHAGDRLDFTLEISNPYPFDITVDGSDYLLEMLWGQRKQTYRRYRLAEDAPLTLPAGGSTRVECSFTVPDDLDAQDYIVGFAVRHRFMETWFCGAAMRTRFIE